MCGGEGASVFFPWVHALNHPGETIVMKIGLISDTHDHLDHIRQATQLFRDRGVDCVIHAGDIVSPPALLAMEGVMVNAVFGNNDGETVGLMKACAKSGGRLEGDFLQLETPDGPIAVYHGTVPALRDGLIRDGRYRAVVSGHTHTPVDRLEGSTRVLNPGTAHGFGQQATVMIYDTAQDKAELISLSGIDRTNRD